MDTQISFKINSVLKEKALSKAKEDGFSLKAIVVAAMKDYVSNRYRLGMVFSGNSKVTETSTNYNSKDWEELIDFSEDNDGEGIDAEKFLEHTK